MKKTKQNKHQNTSTPIPTIQNHILIKGARLHNLKNVDVAIPRNQLVVVTGVSGSGKSSLTIDTLYAEGQRRYVESLSSYARQFLGRMSKPDVDYIKGISPAIAVEQKVVTRSSRSTVGTLTEIYDYLRLLYARIGRTYSPKSGEEVKKHDVTDVVQTIFSLPNDTRVAIYAPQKLPQNAPLPKILSLILQKGFTRVRLNNQPPIHIEDVQPADLPAEVHQLDILIDRFAVQPADDDLRQRCADSVQTAFYEGESSCYIHLPDLPADQNTLTFSNRFEADGIVFEQPTPHFFNFNNPYGACKVCEGFGATIGIDENLVIPDTSLSVYQGAVVPWTGDKMGLYKTRFVEQSHKFNFPIHTPISELTPEQYRTLWEGNAYVKGIDGFFADLDAQPQKVHYRIMLAKYRGRTTCKVCKGTRLREDTQYVKINNHSIVELVLMPIKELVIFFQQLTLSPHDSQVSKRLLIEINNRLAVMNNIGLGYLTLNRQSATLSGGETQRINLTRSLGSNLSDSMYILDEPSIGLHPRDTQRLLEVLQKLRDLGNTVIVVEHDEDVIKTADFLIDMGPEAGHLGGEVVFAGEPQYLPTAERSLTAAYLLQHKQIELPTARRPLYQYIAIENATHHNLKNITVKFPLNAMTVVTGVSGSGKTSLIKGILYPALFRLLEKTGDLPGRHAKINGSLGDIQTIELIDQNPIGRSSRSNPVTYTKAYDSIRDLFAKQQYAKINGFTPKHFSFNVEGGRCETCQGDGYVTIEMQFLADVHLVCESCNGNRFKSEVLEVKYKDKNIAQILDLSIDEAIAFFVEHKDIAAKLQPLAEVGLGYVKLGQSTGTLSGGEAQRVKLASYLGKSSRTAPVLFIFDEPSTGLHFNDVRKLLKAFNALIERGHTIVVIEHNMDIAKCADWLIDLGPEGGNEGGYLLYEGRPEGILDIPQSPTSACLREKLVLTGVAP